MMTPVPPADKSEQPIPGLADLYGFDVQRLDAYYPSHFEMYYTLKGDSTDLAWLINAAQNAHETLHTGIEAICDLLLTIELNCPKEANRNSRIDALALIAELSKMLDITSEAAWKLERTKAATIAVSFDGAG
jgi:hypothetical protein